MIQTEALERAQQILDYEFRDPSLLVKALTHASIADARIDSNERLEFLGDAVLGVIICAELHRRFPDYLEGELTKLKSTVVSRKTCAEIADRIGLSPLMFLGKGMAGRHTLPSSLRAAVLESVIGALFIDAGYETVTEFVLRHARQEIDDADASAHQENHKSMLQQYAQKHLASTPHYNQLDEQGPDHSKCFEVCVVVGGRRFPSAWGASKKEAEQKAAHLAMIELAGGYDSMEMGPGESNVKGSPEEAA